MQVIINYWFGDWSRGDIIAVISALLAAAAIVATLWGWTLRAWLTERRLIAEFGADLYLPEDIANATRYYVRPDATSVDLAQEMEEGSNVVATREDLFKAVERFIDEESKHRHLLLLADAGMGKSSFVLNYYDYNRRRWLKRYKLAIMPLGSEKAIEKIKEIKKPNETILFLDAFDEDPKARKGYEERLDELMRACSDFRRVLITCRTQFFPKDTAIPKAASLVFAPRAGDAQHAFWHLYLAPFSDKQVNTFLRRRFWCWSFKKKRKAREFAKKARKLTIRPMLLTHIPELLGQADQVKTSWDIYAILTEKWYKREEYFWKRTKALKDFSEEVAVQLYLSFLENGSDRVSRRTIIKIVKDLKVSIEDINEWKATARSLLHRDAKGNWKFAHRSIMEFLFLKRFFAGDKRCRRVIWTDQMKKFIMESTDSDRHPHLLSLGNIAGADLSGVDLSEASLTSLDLSEVNFTEANLSNVNLIGANLTQANFTGTDLSGAKIAGAYLNGAIFRDAKLIGADLRGVSFGTADLREANFNHAKLSAATLKEMTLSEVNLAGADLHEVNLSGISLHGINLSRASLGGATLSGLDLRAANLSDAGLTGANLSEAKLMEANLSGASLMEADLREADLSGADLSGANLTGAKLMDTDLSGANLSNASLTGTRLMGAKLTGAKLVGARLIEAKLMKAEFVGANLSGANLTRANITGANLREVVSLEPAQLQVAIFDNTTILPPAVIMPAIAPDLERVRAETRHLLEGEEYDRSIISSRDAVARQTIAAELLAALAGRNPQRRERAGVAFVEQGYFNETARDLREADAPAERAAAARSLALLGDRAATPHLIVALEDQNPDVRRAAVEALGSLRDPAAVAHLEALLERERNERHRIPPRVIRAAADSCRDDDAELDAEVALAEPLPAVERMPDIKAALVEVDAGEWFDFDMSELREELRPAASAVPEAEYEVDVLESSSGEAFAPLAVAAEETTGFETTHFADSRELGPSYAEETAREEIAPATVSEAPAPPAAQHAPVEKGGALFNEHSTVPTSIQQRLASGDAGERAAAIIELSRVDTDEAFQQICAGFDDPSKDVRNAAARSLYELRPDRAESFTRALREASPERRREIGTAISASGLAVESISQLTGESREKTYEAFSLLFLMAKAGEVQPLIRAIEAHPNNEVRLAVVKLLERAGQKEILPAFRRLAVRGSLPTEVRSAVMEAIYQISSSQPTPGSGSPEDMGT